MKLLKQMPAEEMGERDLEFLYNMVKTAISNTEVKESAMEIYWAIAICEQKGYSAEVLKPSKDHLIDLLKSSSDKNLKEKYTLLCVEIIGNEDN